MRFLLLPLLFFATVVFAQTDSSLIDSTEISEHYYEATEDDPPEVVGADDSLVLKHRTFSKDVVDDLKSDSELQYKKNPTIAESLWSRLWAFIKNMLSSLFEKTAALDWLTVAFYVLAIAAVVVIIMMLLKVNAFQMFYGKRSAGTMGATMFDENIHEMDFEALIQEATRARDYRKGVRLVFLYALKILSDKQLIIVEQGKTNHDYVAELEKPELKEGLHELSYYFDYAWYGNFKVSAEVFGKVQNAFSAWRGNIR